MSHQAAALNSLDSIFGDGVSGSESHSGSHTFVDSAYTNLTLTSNSSHLHVHGVRIFVNGTLTTSTLPVTLDATGVTGGNGTPGYVGGNGGTSPPSPNAYTVCVGSQGEGGSLLNGAVCDSGNTAGCQHVYCFGGRGGDGGAGGYGLWGAENYEYPGTITPNATIIRPMLPLHPDIIYSRLQGLSSWYAGQGGGGGGGGAGCAYVNVGSPNGGGGGAGGNGGSMIVLFVKKLVLNTNLTLDARGGYGGNGVYGTNVPEDGNGAGGSAGGGGGGCVVLVVGERTGPGTLTVNVSGGDSYWGFSSGGIGGTSDHGRGGSKGSLWYVNLMAGTTMFYDASDTIQPTITGEAGVYTL